MMVLRELLIFIFVFGVVVLVIVRVVVIAFVGYCLILIMLWKLSVLLRLTVVSFTGCGSSNTFGRKGRVEWLIIRI